MTPRLWTTRSSRCGLWTNRPWWITPLCTRLSSASMARRAARLGEGSSSQPVDETVMLTYANALVRAPGSCLDDIWLADLLDADVGVLARTGRVRPGDDLPLAVSS